MNKRHFVLTAVTIAIALVAVPFAFAQMHGHGGPGGPGEHGGPGFGGPSILGHLGHAKEALGLSDQQVTDIKAIFKSLHDQNAQYRDSLHGGMQAIAMTLINNPNDIAAAQALIDQQSAAEKAMKTNMLNATSKALNVLTAEQRTKLADMVKEHQARMQRRHSEFGDR
jgi:Spy/CpxP family protein refolding chaperone